MGPYYLTSLVTFFGPVVRVSGAVRPLGARAHDRDRTERRAPRIPVDVDTHVTAHPRARERRHLDGHGELRGVGDARAVLRGLRNRRARIPVPDPNCFSDTVSVATSDEPGMGGSARHGRIRGCGARLSDSPTWPAAIETGRPHRASGELAFHVLEIMESIIAAGREHRVIELTSTVERPEPVADGSTPATW